MSKLTRNDLLIRVASEIGLAANIFPTNPADSATILRNAKESADELPHLADILRGFIPHYQGGGLDYATELWFDYLDRFPAKQSRWPLDKREMTGDNQ